MGRSSQNVASKTTAADSRGDLRRSMLQTLERWLVAQVKPSRVCKRRHDIGRENIECCSEVAAHLNLASCHMECEVQAFPMVAPSSDRCQHERSKTSVLGSSRQQMLPSSMPRQQWRPMLPRFVMRWPCPASGKHEWPSLDCAGASIANLVEVMLFIPECVQLVGNVSQELF